MNGKRSGGLWLIMFVVGFVVGGTSGCGYPEVGRRGYEMTMALESAFASRQDESLVSARKLLDEFLAAEEISPREHAVLIDMIDIAEGGDWDRAATSARRLLEAQVEWK